LRFDDGEACVRIQATPASIADITVVRFTDIVESFAGAASRRSNTAGNNRTPAATSEDSTLTVSSALEAAQDDKVYIYDVYMITMLTM